MSSTKNQGRTKNIKKKKKSVLEIVLKTGHIIDVGWFDTQYFFWRPHGSI